MTTSLINAKIQAAATHPDSCHCTDRAVVGDSMVQATAKANGKVRGHLTWFHNGGMVKFILQNPYGVRIRSTTTNENTADEWRAHVEAMFEMLHVHWQAET